MTLTQLPDQITNLYDLDWIKPYCRLIQNNNLWISQKRLSNAYTLLISFRQRQNQPISDLCDFCLIHNIFHLPRQFHSLQPFCLADKFQILHRRLIHVQRRLFRQISDQFFCHLRLFEDIIAVNSDSPIRRRQTTCHNIHCGGFPSAVRPQKAIDMTLLNLERQIVNCQKITITFCQMLYCDHKMTLPAYFDSHLPI